MPHDESRGRQRDDRPQPRQGTDADPASATRESIVNPNKEIVTGYSANMMPTNYGTALTNAELDALVNYVFHSTNTKAKAKRASAKTTSTP